MDFLKNVLGIGQNIKNFVQQNARPIQATGDALSQVVLGHPITPMIQQAKPVVNFAIPKLQQAAPIVSRQLQNTRIPNLMMPGLSPSVGQVNNTIRQVAPVIPKLPQILPQIANSTPRQKFDIARNANVGGIPVGKLLQSTGIVPSEEDFNVRQQAKEILKQKGIKERTLIPTVGIPQNILNSLSPEERKIVDRYLELGKKDVVNAGLSSNAGIKVEGGSLSQLGTNIQKQFAKFVENGPKDVQREAMQRAITQVNDITPQMRRDLVDFAIAAERNAKANLGDLGSRAQTMAEGLFGKQAAGWNNAKMGKAFNWYLQVLDEVPTGLRDVPNLSLVGGRQAKGYKPGMKGEFSALFDKKPRFEIDDSNFKILNTDKWLDATNGNPVDLGSLVKHDKLFKQYPDLKDNVIVKFADLADGANGKAVTENGVTFITLNKKLIGRNFDKDVKKTLLHEIQHAIQSKEGFASGGSVKDYSYAAPYEKPYDLYQKTAGEFEARDVAARADLTPEQRLSTQPYSSENIPLKDLITRFDEGQVMGSIKNKQAGNSMLAKGANKVGETDFMKSMGGLKDYVSTESRKLLQKQGATGQEVAKRIDNYYNNAERSLGGAVADYLNTIKPIPKENVERVLRALDGQPVPLDSIEQVTANKIRGMLNNFAEQADQANLQIKLPDGSKVPFQPRENYLPHMLDMDKFKKMKDLVANHLVQTGQFQDLEMAKKFANEVAGGGSVVDAYQRFFPNKLPARFGNVEMARVIDWPTEVLRYDAKVIPDYLAGATRRIEQARQFGADNEALTPLLDNIAKEGGDPRIAEEIVNRNFGFVKENQQVKKGISALKQAQATIKLGLSAISNTGQSVNTATKYGIVPTIQEMVGSFKPENREFALRAGATVESALQEIAEEAGKGRGLQGKITAPGMKLVENFNRVVSANVGKNIALQKFQKVLSNPNDKKALSELQELGVNVTEALKNGALSEKDLLKAAQKATNLTQFKTRPIDLPPGWSTQTGRLMTQFKSFSYKQSQFIIDNAIKPALKGNVVPLTRYVMLGLVVGEAIADVKAGVRRRERPTNIGERALDNITTVGGIGLYMDAVNAAQRGPEAWMSFIVGPVVGDVSKLAGGIGLASQGKPKTLVNLGLSSIPIVGQTIKNTVNPPTGAYKARTPDLIQEAIGLVPEAKASEDIPTTEQLGEMTPLQRAKVEEQIKELDKQKKDILKSGSGIALFGKRLTGKSDEQKNQTLLELEGKEKQLKSSIKDLGLDAFDKEVSGLAKYKQDNARYTKAREIFADPDVSEETKVAAYKRLKVDPTEVEYDAFAAQNTEVKTSFLRDQASGLGHADVIKLLAGGRKESASGNILASNAVLADLRDEGLISAAEYKTLSKLKVDKGGKVIGGSGGKGKKAKPISFGKLPDLKLGNTGKGTSAKRQARSIPVPKTDLSLARLDIKVPSAIDLPLSQLLRKSKSNLNVDKARSVVSASRGGSSSGRTPTKLSRSFYRGG